MISKLSYLGAKAWALLHDPPHKAWYLTNRCRLIAGGHEKDAEWLWSKAVEGTPLGQLSLDSKIGETVDRADRLAAGLDRWLLMRHPRDAVHDYVHLVNVFMPELKNIHQNPLTLDESAIKRFASDLNEVLKTAGSEMGCYQLLYASLELAWTARGLPLGPADTRLPTHTIFDHLYACAAMVNWALEDMASGFYVLLDIPGIQRTITSARKAGDLWAGSWLISLLMWRLVEEVVKSLGPDVLLLPTARLNPFHIELLKNDGLLKERLSSMFKHSGMEELLSLAGAMPVIPGTASLALPNPALLDGTPYKGSSEEDVEAYFLRRWDAVWKELALELEALGERDDTVGGTLIAKITRENREIFGEPQLGLRVYAVSMRSVHESLVKMEEGQQAELFIEDDARSLKEALELVKRAAEDKRDMEAALRALLFYAAHLALKRKRYERDTTRLSLWPLWPVKYTEIFNPVFKTEGGWAYCGVCGLEPALVRFGLQRQNMFEEYDSQTKEWIEKEVGRSLSNQEYKDLEVLFKPGEALGSLCLIKRGLWTKYPEKVKGYYDNVVPSNEAIANSVTRKALKEIEGSIRDSILELIFFGKSEVDYSGIAWGLGLPNFTAIKNAVRSYYKNQLPESELQKAYSAYISALGVETRFTRRRSDAEMLLPKAYYSILKGDGDSIGELLRGRLPLKAERYAGALIECVGIKGEAAELIKEASRVADQLGLTLIPSPAYVATLSRALMLQALKDAKIVKEHQGFLIYAGGDDVLALLPTETALRCVGKLRRSYWGDASGFHKLKGLVAAAPTAYGRSFSLRYAHVMDPMKAEISEAMQLLESKAKKARWDDLEKDTLVISRGRTQLTTRIPLREKGELDALESAWRLILTGHLSPSVAEDYRELEEAAEHEEISREIIHYVLQRNVDDRTISSELEEKLLSSHYRISKEILINGIELLRVLPS
jgi:CRISPR-associated protein Cmr2